MYLDYWQLVTKPFEPRVERGVFFPCEVHEGALMKLRYAVENRRGAAVLAGPTGVGKTMLVQLLRGVLPAEFRPFVHLVFPQMSSRDLLVYLAEQSGSPPAEAPRHTIEESVRRLESFLTQNAAAGRHAVLVIDEAHLLEDCGALETLRLLLNFEAAGQPMLTLLLVGQMGLVSAVGRLPSLEERISVKTLVRTFTAEETAAYVRHRLDAAGATRDLFTPDAVEALHYLSHGTPRQINRLGDLALLVGFADRLPHLSAQQIESVSEELIAIAAE
ncbi:MAG: AAA family ATPase [Planctomycetes bacterium]|nr:AAA family ATPase [Planctomycetota bacterium]